MLCDYGCGLESKYFFSRSKKNCCSSHYTKCPAVRQKLKGRKHTEETKKKIGKKHRGKTLSDKTKKKISDANKGRKLSEKHVENIIKNLTGRECSEQTKRKLRKSNLGKKRSKETKEKNRLAAMKTKNRLGHSHNKYTKKKLSILNRKKISYWEKNYPLFSKIEEMRYNPDKPEEKEIQVHCKNHNCPNSKEKGGWFTPTYIQLRSRIEQIEYLEKDNCYFYCSDECKQSCPLYGLRSDPFKEIEKSYTSEEINIWKKTVLEQDNYKCQKCGTSNNLHCHHIKPVKTHPHMALDPDNGIVLCEQCHYKYGHQKGSECSTKTLANKYCERKQ